MKPRHLLPQVELNAPAKPPHSPDSTPTRTPIAAADGLPVRPLNRTHRRESSARDARLAIAELDTELSKEFRLP